MAHHTCNSLRALQAAESQHWQGPWHKLDTIPNLFRSCGTCWGFLAAWVLTVPYGAGRIAQCQGGSLLSVEGLALGAQTPEPQMEGDISQFLLQLVMISKV